MDEPLNSGCVGKTRQPRRRIDVHGLKGLVAMLDIETDGVHHSVGAANRTGHGLLVVDIPNNRQQIRVIARKELVAPVRMP